MTIAIIFIGNSGVGKSTLLSQIGGNFQSGVKFRKGFTKDIFEETVQVNGKEIVLMDVPGLFEPDNAETEKNARMLASALNRGYDYKVFFVLKANNRGPDDAEMVMMAKFNEQARRIDGAKISFRVIVNQIMDQEVYDIYRDNVAGDNFRGLFSSLNLRGFSFDIKIDKVILLWFNTESVQQQQFRDIIANEIEQHQAFSLQKIKEFIVSNVDLDLFQRAIKALLVMAGIWMNSKEKVSSIDLIRGGLQAFNSYQPQRLS
ncbi:hypothetical protein BGZ46_008580 [Entomortierella lignicola]|nr:hypothetical protein BGZ46_008580 [Entomortierella lignicola]